MRKGQKTPDEVRLKQSLANKGKKKNYPVWNKGKKIGNLWPNSGQFKKGFKKSPEAIEKHRLKMIGRKQTEEHRKNNRLSQYQRFIGVFPEYIPGQKRKLRLIKNGGFHSKGEWETLKAQYNWTCPACNKREPIIKLTKDHIISVLNGGSDNIENIQPLCRPCNTRKYTKEIRYLGRA
jgi:5-methylcytosine-specific restriction endonuclease McrA